MLFKSISRAPVPRRPRPGPQSPGRTGHGDTTRRCCTWLRRLFGGVRLRRRGAPFGEARCRLGALVAACCFHVLVLLTLGSRSRGWATTLGWGGCGSGTRGKSFFMPWLWARRSNIAAVPRSAERSQRTVLLAISRSRSACSALPRAAGVLTPCTPQPWTQRAYLFGSVGLFIGGALGLYAWPPQRIGLGGAFEDGLPGSMRCEQLSAAAASGTVFSAPCTRCDRRLAPADLRRAPISRRVLPLMATAMFSCGGDRALEASRPDDSRCCCGALGVSRVIGFLSPFTVATGAPWSASPRLACG